MPIKVSSVESQYAKYKELRKEDVEALQRWIEKQPHLPPVSELQIIQVFQSCYFKIEATKTAIDAYFTLKAQWPEYFSGRNPNNPVLKQAVDICLVTVLPDQTPEGYMVVFAKLLDNDPSKFNFMSYIKLFDMIGTLWLAENGTAEGMVLIIDMQNISLAHLSTFTISAIRNLLYYLQEALPVRLKIMHYINAGVAMEKLMLLMKPFIKKELLEILHIFPKVDDNFYRLFPKQRLPSDYGGDAPSIASLHANMKNKVLDGADYLVEQEKFIADESKRLEKRIGYAQEYGMDGSFKKLELD